MVELNPYQPPCVDTAASNTFESTALERRWLPRSFWLAWTTWVAGASLMLIAIFAATGVDGVARSPIGLPILGLFLAPFILVRAKLCEKYQHQSMAFSGTQIFLTCMGVTLGLGSASLFIWFLLYMILTVIISVWIPPLSTNHLQLAAIPISGMMAVVAYLKFIDLSAQRPRLT